MSTGLTARQRQWLAVIRGRILVEWVKVQLAVIESGLVTLDEVMFPYLQLRGGETVFEAVQSGRLALPGPAGRAE